MVPVGVSVPGRGPTLAGPGARRGRGRQRGTQPGDVGAEALDAWVASLGATNSTFYSGNTTTSSDLATLWTSEVEGSLGGATAQGWLYPLLTNTRTESGVPAGVAGRAVVVHKTGTIDQVDNDAALVTSGPNGPYVLVVMTDGLGGAAGWQLIDEISATVWQFEASRPQ